MTLTEMLEQMATLVQEVGKREKHFPPLKAEQRGVQLALMLREVRNHQW